MRLWTILAATAVLAGAAGCAAAPAQDWDPSNADSALKHANDNGYVEAAAALEDRQVTSEEWAALHDDWVDCMETIGFAFEPPLLDPVNQQEFLEKREYRGEGQPDEAKMTACDDRYDFSAGQIYYLTVGPSMNPDLLAAVRHCLEDHDLAFTGTETKYHDFFPENDPQAAAEGPIADCVTQETLRLFPGVSIVNLNF